MTQDYDHFNCLNLSKFESEEFTSDLFYKQIKWKYTVLPDMSKNCHILLAYLEGDIR